jgi:hypothetical protein
LIENALTCWVGKSLDRRFKRQRRTKKVMTTLFAISVSWLSVLMIYIIAGSDRRERRY